MTTHLSDFFLLRTPLVSIERLLNVLQADALPQFLQDKLVAEAIHLASASFYNHLIQTGTNSTKLTETALKYAIRMSTRCTPFGLFAGCTVGFPGEQTTLDFTNKQIQRHSRLDMAVLVELTQLLIDQPLINNQLRFYPNTSLYRIGAQFRYTETGMVDQKRTFFITRVPAQTAIVQTLDRAQSGATLRELATPLVDTDVTFPEAMAFVEQLVGDGVLVSELEPGITGPDFFSRLIDRLGQLIGTESVVHSLRTIDYLLQKQSDGIEQAQAIRQILQDDLGLEVSANNLVQCDVFLTGSAAQLSRKAIGQVQKTLAKVAVLNQISATHPELETFKQRFYTRYEEQEIPLLLALDAETGIGYAGSDGMTSELDPIIGTLPTGQTIESKQPVKDDAFLQLLIRKYTHWLQHREDSIDLTDEDLNTLNESAVSFPDSFYALGYFLAESAGAIDEGRFRFMLKSMGGPSAFHLMGRFCAGNPLLTDLVTNHLSQRQATDPNRIYAEIAHLPEFRVGNVLRRPHLQAWEIPYLAGSSLPPDQQIPLHDLMVSVPGGAQIVLRSKRLGKAVIPQLTTAHNYTNGLPIYRFLCDLQQQHSPFMTQWSWGVFSSCPHLPRVSYRNIILQEARWLIDSTELTPTLSDEDNVQALRKRLHLPRFVALTESDNELFLDLDTVSCRQLLVSTLRRTKTSTVIEWLRTPDNCFITNAEGKLTHEIIIPFNRPVSPLTNAPIARSHETETTRTFLPGSDWIYLKLYGGTQTANTILEAIVPELNALVESGQLLRWFFVRYQDPDSHLRLRLRLASDLDYQWVLMACRDAIQPFAESREIHKVQQDTYQRELERYGATRIEQAESIFYADSQTVIDLLAISTDSDFLYKAALLGIDGYLTDFGWSMRKKVAFTSQVFDGYFSEHGGTAELRQALAEKYRPVAKNTVELIQKTFPSNNELAAYDLIIQRSAHIKSWVGEVLATDDESQLPVFVESIIHLFLNRLFSTDQRTYELVLYHHLTKAYRSLIARARV